MELAYSLTARNAGLIDQGEAARRHGPFRQELESAIHYAGAHYKLCGGKAGLLRSGQKNFKENEERQAEARRYVSKNT